MKELAQQNYIETDIFVVHIAAASSVKREANDRHLIDPCRVLGSECLTVLGSVRPHTDGVLFPNPWCYLLILRCDDKSTVLKQHGKHPLVLRSGMLIELEHHRRHSVRQNDTSILVWRCYDSDKRLPLSEALRWYCQRLGLGDVH